jgi:hypothetical protein
MLHGDTGPEACSLNTNTVTERLEDLRAQLCGISGQAHKLHREVEAIQGLTHRFPDSTANLAVTLKSKMAALVQVVDALALATLQLEQYVRWAGTIKGV